MQTFYPVLKYEDARAAIDFLERAFGFESHAVYDGENGGVAHAEIKAELGGRRDSRRAARAEHRAAARPGAQRDAAAARSFVLGAGRRELVLGKDRA